MEVPASQQQREPPPYHHHHNHHRRYSRHGPAGSVRVQRGSVDYRIPAIEKYAYCLCLHVKPTTIFVAALELMDAFWSVSIILNGGLSIEDQLLHGSDMTRRSTAVAVEIMTRIILASASAVAIYAVMSGRAALLMPLYSVLLIDFFFALPSFYGRDLDSDGAIGTKNYSPANNEQFDRYSVFTSTITMVAKIYFLCVIWKCYRYLRLIQLVGEMCSQMPNPIVRALRLEEGSPDGAPGQSAAPPPYETVASSSKPPNYEDAIKSSNIYSIDIQPQNTSLPNYSSISPHEGGQSSAISIQPLPYDDASAPTRNHVITAGQGIVHLDPSDQKAHPKTPELNGLYVDVQSLQTGDIVQSETLIAAEDKSRANPSSRAARDGSS